MSTATQPTHAAHVTQPLTTSSITPDPYRSPVHPWPTRHVRSGQLSATDRLYDFLTTYIAAYGYAPSYAEMAAALGWHSLSTPLYHIRKLAAAGRIEHTPRTARGLRLLGDMGAGNTPA